MKYSIAYYPRCSLAKLHQKQVPSEYFSDVLGCFKFYNLATTYENQAE
jgi:hypothetical protein